MTDLSHYKLTDDWSWYERYAELMGEEQLKEYINSVYIRLDQLQVGEFFYVEKKVKKENWELFVKAAGWYQKDYRAGTHKDDIAFSRHYTIIFKYKF